MESLRLEKTSKIIKSNRQSNTTMPSKTRKLLTVSSQYIQEKCMFRTVFTEKEKYMKEVILSSVSLANGNPSQDCEY